MRPSSNRMRSLATLAGIAVVTSVGAWLRLAQVRTGLYGDELFAYREIAGASPLQVITNVLDRSIEVTPPLYFLLASAASRVSELTVALRIPSELAGIALIPAVWVLGRLAVSNRAGLTAAALTAFSVHAIYYSVEARPYATAMLLSAASTCLLLRYLDSTRIPWLIGYGIASAAAVYTHYSVVFVLFAQLAWALVRFRSQASRLLIANVIAALSFLPWAAQVKFKQGARMTLAPFAPSGDTAVRWFRQLVTLPYADDVSIREVPGLVPACLLAGCVLVAALVVGARVVSARPLPRLDDRTVLLLLLAAASPVGMALVSIANGLEFMQSRYFSASFPALMVLTGALLTVSGRRLGIGLSVIAIGASLWGAVRASRAEFQRPDMRSVTKWIEVTGGSNAVIIDRILPTNGPWALRPYLARPERDQPRPADPRFPNAALPRELVELAERFNTGLIVVTNAAFMPQAERELTSDPRSGFEVAASRTWPGLGGGIRAVYLRRTDAPASSNQAR